MWPVWPGWITKHLCEACIDSVSPFQPWISMSSQCALSWCAQITRDRVTSRAALHKTLWYKMCSLQNILWNSICNSQNTLWYTGCRSQNNIIQYDQITRQTMIQCVQFSKHYDTHEQIIRYTMRKCSVWSSQNPLWHNACSSQNTQWYILRFILPCKSDCHPNFGIAQFVAQFTHVSRHFGALSRKNCFDNLVSNLWKNHINCL